MTQKDTPFLVARLLEACLCADVLSELSPEQVLYRRLCATHHLGDAIEITVVDDGKGQKGAVIVKRARRGPSVISEANKSYQKDF
jgi:hypothetical protein